MGIGLVRSDDLDQFVRECEDKSLLATPAGRKHLSGFQLSFKTKVDQSLDPFSADYFQQQLELYREISGRELDQETGKLTPIDVDAHAAGSNPYNQPNIGYIARHVRAIQGSLMAANLPPSAEILDMGCGWGLSSESNVQCPGLGHAHHRRGRCPLGIGACRVGRAGWLVGSAK